MAKQVYSNNASALLATSINPADVSIQVDAGYGQFFPNPGASEFFVVTLENASGDIEICHYTSRTTDILTVTRAQEGTTALNWTAGLTRVECRLTAGSLEEFIQRQGDQMSGDLNMATNELQNANLTGTTVITGGQSVGMAVRGALNDSSNELAVPGDGSRATAGGSPIATIGEFNTLLPINTIVMWYGSPATVPTGWQICNGTNGTPDLRNRFPLGASTERALGSSDGVVVASGGGPASANTDSGGAHTHSPATTLLTANMIPGHDHPLRIQRNSGDIVDPGNPTLELQLGNIHYFNNGGSRGYQGGGASFGKLKVDPGGPAVLQGHTHSIGSSGSHNHSIDRAALEPGNVAVHFIMKLANFAP